MAAQVTVSGAGNAMQAHIASDKHEWHVDEPVAYGGKDEFPDPYEYLLGALGSCKVITMAMYAQRKGWPLESTEVQLRHYRVHAKDCQECPEKDVKLDRVSVSIKIMGNLTPEQRGRIYEIANRCPVHKTLEGGAAIEARLVEE